MPKQTSKVDVDEVIQALLDGDQERFNALMDDLDLSSPEAKELQERLAHLIAEHLAEHLVESL